MHFKFWSMLPYCSTKKLELFMLPSIAFKTTYLFTFLPAWCFINRFLIFVNMVDETSVALYSLNLYFSHYEWRRTFSPVQYIYIVSYKLCPFSNGLLYLLLYKIFWYIKSCLSCVISKFLIWLCGIFAFQIFLVIRFIDPFLYEFSIWSATYKSYPF